MDTASVDAARIKMAPVLVVAAILVQWRAASGNDIWCGFLNITGEVSPRPGSGAYRVSASHPYLDTSRGFHPGVDYTVMVWREERKTPVLGFYLTTTVCDADIPSGPFWLSGYNVTVSCRVSAAHARAPNLTLPLELKWRTNQDKLPCVELRLAVVESKTTWYLLSYPFKKSSACLRFLSNKTGYFTSNNYPGHYPDDFNCTYLISTAESKRISVQKFDIEPPYRNKCLDYIEVSGTAVESREKFCGEKHGGGLGILNFRSASRFLKIRFVADKKIAGSGFCAFYYTTSADGCNTSFTALSGNFTSPNFPGDYYPNLYCVMNVRLPREYRIWLEITFLDVQRGDSVSCDSDYLDLASVRFCGRHGDYDQESLTYESSGHSVQVIFRTDHTQESRGFQIVYRGIESCSNHTYHVDKGNLTSVNHPLNYLNNQACHYTINVSRSLYAVELTFDKFVTESPGNLYQNGFSCNLDYVEIFDDRQFQRICGNWSGREHLLVFRSFGSYLELRFVSNDKITKPGYSAKWKSVLHNTSHLHCDDSWMSSGQGCFEIVHDKKSWTEGDEDCRVRGGHLATIKSLDTQVLLDKFINSSNSTTSLQDAYWIGASDRHFEGEFYWSDGTKVNFNYWFPGWPHFQFSNRQPSDDGYGNEDCVEMRRSFHLPKKTIRFTDSFFWNDRQCFIKNSYICQNYKFGAQIPTPPLPVTCDHYIELKPSSPSAMISSPKFPDNYPDFASCNIVVHGTVGYQLIVEFQHFILEDSDGCVYDYFSLSAYPYGNQSPDRHYCGNSTDLLKSLRWVSPTNYLFAKFVSDHSISYSGFSALFTIINSTADCHGNGWKLVGSKCYKVKSTLLPYRDAQVSCNLTGGHLPLTQPFNNSSFVITNVLAKLPGIIVGQNVTIWQHTDFTSQDNQMSAEDVLCIGTIIHILKTANGIYNGRMVLQQFPCSSHLVVVCQKYARQQKQKIQYTSLFLNGSGQLSSPEFPSEYISNRDIHYSLTTWLQFRIFLHLVILDVEYQKNCEYDFLAIHTGGKEPSTKLCTSQNFSSYFLSKNNSLQLMFHTDVTVTGKGFLINWTAFDPTECHHLVLTKPEGIWQTPNFPMPYPEQVNCSVILRSLDDQRMLLEIIHLQFSPSDKCENFLEIIYSDKAKRKICNFNEPFQQIFLSTTNIIKVHFQSLRLTTRDGVQLKYKSTGSSFSSITKSLHVNTNESGILCSLNFPDLYPHDFQQTVLLQAPYGNLIHIMISYLNIEHSPNCSRDFLKITDISFGVENALLITKLCTNLSLNSAMNFTSYYHQLTLHFKTDSDPSTVHFGFQIRYHVESDPSFWTRTNSLLHGTFDLCSKGICQNGSNCQKASENRFTCKCPANYTGIFCQHTWCEIEPCVNGVCLISEDSYRCECKLNFWGEHCNLDRKQCRQQLCSNHGNCFKVASSKTTCHCDVAWTGENCSRKTDSKMHTNLPHKNQLLREPIWIGLIVIVVVLTVFGLVYILRRYCTNLLPCTKRKREKQDDKHNQTAHNASHSAHLSTINATTCQTPSNQSLKPQTDINDAINQESTIVIRENKYLSFESAMPSCSVSNTTSVQVPVDEITLQDALSQDADSLKVEIVTQMAAATDHENHSNVSLSLASEHCNVPEPNLEMKSDKIPKIEEPSPGVNEMPKHCYPIVIINSESSENLTLADEASVSAVQSDNTLTVDTCQPKLMNTASHKRRIFAQQNKSFTSTNVSLEKPVLLHRIHNNELSPLVSRSISHRLKPRTDSIESDSVCTHYCSRGSLLLDNPSAKRVLSDNALYVNDGQYNVHHSYPSHHHCHHHHSCYQFEQNCSHSRSSNNTSCRHIHTCSRHKHYRLRNFEKRRPEIFDRLSPCLGIEFSKRGDCSAASKSKYFHKQVRRKKSIERFDSSNSEIDYEKPRCHQLRKSRSHDVEEYSKCCRHQKEGCCKNDNWPKKPKQFLSPEQRTPSRKVESENVHLSHQCANSLQVQGQLLPANLCNKSSIGQSEEENLDLELFERETSKPPLSRCDSGKPPSTMLDVESLADTCSTNSRLSPSNFFLQNFPPATAAPSLHPADQEPCVVRTRDSAYQTKQSSMEKSPEVTGEGLLHKYLPLRTEDRHVTCQLQLAALKLADLQQHIQDNPNFGNSTADDLLSNEDNSSHSHKTQIARQSLNAVCTNLPIEMSLEKVTEENVVSTPDSDTKLNIFYDSKPVHNLSDSHITEIEMDEIKV